MKAKLKELGVILTGITPKTSNRLYYEYGNYMFAGPSDLQKGKYIRKTEKMISQDAYTDYKSKFINKNDICVSCIGYLGYVSMAQEKMLTNQQINSITSIDHNKILPEYLYYKLLSIKSVFESYGGTGSAVPIINKTTFENIEITIHDLSEQQHIVDILGSIDNSIENNNKLAQDLEDLAVKKYSSLIAKSSNFICLKEVIDLYDSQRVPLSSRERELRKGSYPYYGATGILDYVDNYLFSGDIFFWRKTEPLLM